MNAKTSAYSEAYSRFVLSGFTRSLLVRLGSLIYIGFLGRALTLSEMGVIVFLSISSAIIITSSDFGLHYSMTQRAIFHGAEKGMNIIKSCFISMMVIGPLYSSMMTVFFLVFIAGIGDVQLSLEAQIEFLIINISGVIFRTIVAAEVSLMKVDRSIYLRTLNAVLLYILVIIFFIMRPVIESVLIGMAVPNIVILLVELGTMKTIMEHEGVSKSEIFNLLRFGIPVFFATIASTLSGYVDRWIVFAGLSGDDLAIYHLMRRLSGVALEFALVLTTGLFPIYTRLFADSDERLAKGFSHVLRIVLTISVPFFLVLFFFAKTVIIIVLSEKYVEGEQVLMALLIASIFYLIGIMTISVKIAKGETIKFLIYWLMLLILNVVFGVVLLPYGSEGVAIAILIASVIGCLYAIAVTAETRKVPFKWFFRFFIFIVFTSIILFLIVETIPFPFSLVIVLSVILFLPALFGLISLHEFEVIRRVTPKKIEKTVLFYERISRVGFLPPIQDLA